MPSLTSDPRFRTFLAMLVHVYTALGLVTTFAAAIFLMQQDLRGAYLALFASVVIDATDGTLARAAEVKRYAPWINGRKLDDIVDYVTYTFLTRWGSVSFLPFWFCISSAASSDF
jgi:phosphatidylcholine synthase